MWIIATACLLGVAVVAVSFHYDLLKNAILFDIFFFLHNVQFAITTGKKSDREDEGDEKRERKREKMPIRSRCLASFVLGCSSLYVFLGPVTLVAGAAFTWYTARFYGFLRLDRFKLLFRAPCSESFPFLPLPSFIQLLYIQGQRNEPYSRTRDPCHIPWRASHSITVVYRPTQMRYSSLEMVPPQFLRACVLENFFSLFSSCLPAFLLFSSAYYSSSWHLSAFLLRWSIPL